MSLLAAVHAFLAKECGAHVADEAVVEYVAETVRAGDVADAWQDLDELLGGLSPDVWAGRAADQRENLLMRLWNMVRLPLRLTNIAGMQNSVARRVNHLLPGDRPCFCGHYHDTVWTVRSHYPRLTSAVGKALVRKTRWLAGTRRSAHRQPAWRSHSWRRRDEPACSNQPADKRQGHATQRSVLAVAADAPGSWCAV